MNEEIDAIEKNDTLDLVDIPAGKQKKNKQKSIGVKWIYKLKYNGKAKLSSKTKC